MSQVYTPPWHPPPPTSSLSEDVVHVWRIDLDAEAEKIGRLKCLLSEGERERAARYVRRQDHDAFIVARGMLRRILADYCSVAPETLVFGCNEYGKPFFKTREAPSPLLFNLAHSGRMALVAICLHRRVGIDIEQIHSSLEWESIARYYFTSTERSELQALPPAHRLRAFIRYWVRKEAYVKALGTGLGSGLDHFEISVELNISSGRVRPLERVPGKPEWSFQDIPVGLDYEAAIVLEGVIPRIECWFCERG